MKTVTIKELKKELTNCSYNELMELCLRLAKFKKENKELLRYLLLESTNEEEFIQRIKIDVDDQFDQINTKTSFYSKKSIRKISRFIKTNIRYSKNKETEVELLLYFCKKMNEFNPYIKQSTVLKNILNRELESIHKKITFLQEDLQFDYRLELQTLENKNN